MNLSDNSFQNSLVKINFFLVFLKYFWNSEQHWNAYYALKKRFSTDAKCISSWMLFFFFFQFKKNIITKNCLTQFWKEKVCLVMNLFSVEKMKINENFIKITFILGRDSEKKNSCLTHRLWNFFQHYRSLFRKTSDSVNECNF